MEITATIDGKVKETDVPQPSTPTQTHVADEAASIGVDVRHGGAAITISSLDVGQGSGNIDKTPVMPYDSPLLRVHTLRSDKGRITGGCTDSRSLEHEMEADFEFTTAENVSTANVSVNTPGAEISTASPKVKIAGIFIDDVAAEGLMYIRRSAVKRKDKALRLQEQFNEEERQRIASVHKEASAFKPVEWDNIQLKLKLMKMKRVNTFALMESDDTVPKVVVGSSKRSAEEELGEESLKRQKIREGSKPAEESKDKESDELSQEQLQ
ncbi:hypothetical protein Tco_0845743 [Tanacetum coccineum]